MVPRFKWWRLLALAAGLALLGQPGGGHAATPSISEDDALLLDVRLDDIRLGDGVKGYQTKAGICLDLKDIAVALDVALKFSPDGDRAEGWAFDQRQTILIDRKAGKERVAGRIAALPAGAILDTPDGWCVGIADLDRWLGVTLEPDTTNALLIVRSAVRLPVQIAAERAELARTLRAQSAGDAKALARFTLPYDLWRTPAIDALVHFVGENDHKKGGGAFKLGYELLGSGEIGYFSSEMRMISDNGLVPQSLRTRLYRIDPEAQLLGGLHATDIELGDISGQASALVSKSVAGLGFSLTNRPPNRPDRFDTTSFRGALANGWDAELYHNGQLIRVISAGGDGRYEFLDVPLYFGTNIFEIVRYGPQGQVQRESRNLTVGAEAIPPGKSWWWIDGVRDNHDLIGLSHPQSDKRGWRAGFGFEHGIDLRTALGISAQSLAIGGRRADFVEMFARRSLGPAIAETSVAMDGNAGHALQFRLLGRLLDTNFAIETAFAKDFESERIDATLKSRQSLTIDRSLTLDGRVLPVHFDLQSVQGQDERLLEAGGRVSVSVNRIFTTLQVAWRRREDLPTGLVTNEADLGLLIGGHIGPVRLHGEVDWGIFGRCGFRGAQLKGEWANGTKRSWRTFIAYDRDSGEARSGLGFSQVFQRFVLSLNADAQSDGAVHAMLGFQFSLGRDADGRLDRLSRDRLAGTGSIAARVYQDDNGSGARDPGERWLDNVGLRIANTPIQPPRSPGDGAMLVDGLAPGAPVAIRIDTASISDTFLEPVSPGLLVIPRAGLMTKIELGVMPSARMEGTLMTADGHEAAGRAIALVDVVTGRAAASVKVEFDGLFQFEHLRYGRYRLQLGERDAANTLRDGLVLDGRRPSLNLGTIVIGGGGGKAAPVNSQGAKPAAELLSSHFKRALHRGHHHRLRKKWRASRRRWRHHQTRRLPEWRRAIAI